MLFPVRCFPFLLLALCWVLPACQTTGAEKDRMTIPYGEMDEKTTQALERKNFARTAKSLAPWKGKQISGLVAEDYVRVCTVRVLAGDMKIKIGQTGPGKFSVSLAPGPSGDSGSSSAAAISADGYFLTAAHCVSRDRPVKVLAWTKSKKLVARPARVVWVGDKEKADVALLKADLKPLYWLPLADDATLSPDEPVLLAGYGNVFSDQRSSDGRRVAGGVILQAEAAQSDDSGAKWRAFHHTGPLLRGDSGGPVIDARGKLLGVNSSVYKLYYETWGISWGWLGWSGTTAISPDAAWIQRLIERDRRRARR